MKKGKSLEQLEDKYFGEKGTPKRDEYEEEMNKIEEQEALQKNDQEDINDDNGDVSKSLAKRDFDNADQRMEEIKKKFNQEEE